MSVMQGGQVIVALCEQGCSLRARTPVRQPWMQIETGIPFLEHQDVLQIPRIKAGNAPREIGRLSTVCSSPRNGVG